MKNLFFMGGPLFMGILTLLFITMVLWMVFHFIRAYHAKEGSKEIALRNLKYGKSIGLFALIIGILGQLIGLYSAFEAIERAGDISPTMVYGGIKVSMISTLYGITIFLFSLAMWFFASLLIEKRLK